MILIFVQLLLKTTCRICSKIKLLYTNRCPTEIRTEFEVEDFSDYFMNIHETVDI